jgi:uncharacterized protein YndB with AHSA1/START domain
MITETNSPTTATDLEIVSNRVFAAPRNLVFEAFSNPNHLVHWWGPKDFTNTFQEFDLRPGGAWRFVMHGPDGSDYPTAKTFLEVVEPERIVFQELGETHRFLMTMTFAEQSSSTTLTWRMLFESATEFANVKPHIVIANEENFDRLEAYLEELTLKKYNA